MNRYLAFHFLEHYPDGGWNDLVGSFATAEEAFAACDGESRDQGSNIQVIDLETGKEVQRQAVLL